MTRQSYIARHGGAKSSSWRKLCARPYLFSFLLILLTSVVYSADEQLAQQINDLGRLQVSKIHVEAYGAFDSRIPAYRSWPFRFANKLHIRTRDSFIQRELLLHEGDYVDQDIIQESERNLRAYKFLEDVHITARPVGSGKADLYVHTEDQWTTQIDISAGHSAGFSTFKTSIEESNFLGFGKTLHLGYDRNPERSTYEILYFDPQFVNTRWNFEAGYQPASDGRTYTTNLIRPFYSLDTKWAYGISWDSATSTQNLYPSEGGTKVAEIDRNQRNGLFFAARSWGERYDKKRFGILVSLDNLAFPNPARIIYPDAATLKEIKKNLHPFDRQDYQYGMLFKWNHQQFVKDTFLDNFGRIEDLPVGLQFGATVTRSQNTQGQSTTSCGSCNTYSTNADFYQLQTIAQFTSQMSSQQFVALYSEFGVRRQTSGGFSNLIFNAFGHYYLQLDDAHLGPLVFPRQTLAANVSTILTKNVDAPFQISLGENEGLRGYTFKSFTGENRVLINVEDRIFTPLNYRLFAIGLAAFVDAGSVWSGDENLRFTDFPVSVGIGLRLGLKKAQSAKVVRLDFAVPLRKVTSPFTTSQPRGWSLSVSSGQIFTILGDVPRLFTLL